MARIGWVATQSAEWIAAARLMRRIGFGAAGAAVDAIAGQEPAAYLDRILASDPDADPGAIATPLPELTPPAKPAGDQTDDAMAAYEEQRDAQMRTLTSWWLTRMASVEEPIHEKLTLLWHNHFATSAKKVRYAAWMAVQNQALRTLKLGDFRTLAYAMLTDAAMLRWLDGIRNTAASPNENLSREFMELFALGHGNGYGEIDVREGARALTGWAVGRGGQPHVVAKDRDPQSKTVLGVSGDLDAAAFCDIVLAAPESAHFVAGRLWRQLAIDSAPPPGTLDRLVAAYGPNRDLMALTKAILTDPEFTEHPGGMINTPTEWAVGLVRSLRVPFDARLFDLPLTKGLADTLTNLGHKPFYPPDVGGWPSGRAWLSNASTDIRFAVAVSLAGSADLSTVEQAAAADRMDAAGYLLGIGAWTDHSAQALRKFVDNPPALVAAAANTPENLTS